MKIATTAYPVEFLSSWQSYEDKMSRWVEDAARNGANLLVFPEYAAMELASLAGEEDAGDLEKSVLAVAERMIRAQEVIAKLAREHGVYILAPSGPVFDGTHHRPVNRAHFYTPKGGVAYQDKQIMTRFEREEWSVSPGGPLKVIETDLAKIGILICYDVEFPLLARALAEAGAEILLCPSCTDSLAGFTRVKVGAMARALENQCVVVHAPTVGHAPWCPAIDDNVGAAGIYGPPDKGFPLNGIMAQGDMNFPGWVYATASLQAIHEVRTDGHVLNFQHWPEQAACLQSVTKVQLP